MKLFLYGFLLVPTLVLAQTVDVKNVDSSEDTTVEIHKGKKVDKENDKKLEWQLQDGTADVEGESGFSTADGKKAWKQSCDDWKKEFRADNKENKIIQISCGSPVCAGEAGNKICTSKASYKIKTKI